MVTPLPWTPATMSCTRIDPPRELDRGITRAPWRMPRRLVGSFGVIHLSLSVLIT